MKCPNPNELNLLVQKGIMKRRKNLIKTLIDDIKYRASTGCDDLNYLIFYEEDGQYCVDYFKKHGYTVTLQRAALSGWRLCIKWGK